MRASWIMLTSLVLGCILLGDLMLPFNLLLQVLLSLGEHFYSFSQLIDAVLRGRSLLLLAE